MKLAIVTDSTAYLNERVRNHKDLFIIPIPVIIDDLPFDEGVDIGYEEFYQKLKSSKDFPKTSQPVLGEVYELFRSIKEQGYDTVISIHLSEGISGFVRTLTAIKDDIEGLQVIPYDSKITSVPMGYMVEKALEMSDEKNL